MISLHGAQDVDLGSHLLFDRPGLALRNLLSGDWSGAGKAVYDPESLTPEQRQSLAQRWGIDGHPVLEGVLQVTTNPLLLAGLLFSLVLPLPTASQLATFKGGVQRLASRMPWMKCVSPVAENLRGTEIPGLLQSIHRERVGVLKFYQEGLEGVFARWKHATGRASLSADEGVLAAAMLDDLANPANQMWTSLRKFLSQHHEPRLVAALNDPLPELRRRIANAPSALHDVVRDTRKLFTSAWDKWLASPDNQQRIRRVLSEQQGFKGAVSFDELRRLQHYWPHTRMMTPEQRFDAITEYARKFHTTKLRRKLQHGMETRQAYGLAADRHSKMLPDPVALEQLGASDDVQRAVRWVDPRLTPEKLQQLVEAGKIPRDLAATALGRDGRPLYYDLRYDKGIRSYMDQMSRMVSFTIPPKTPWGSHVKSLGDRLKEAKDDLITRFGDTGREAAMFIEDTLIPQVAGGMSIRQSEKALKWNVTKQAAIGWLESPKVKALLDVGYSGHGDRFSGKLTRWLRDDPGSSWAGIGAGIADWTYASTLGFPNLVPTGMNLLQSISTFGPLGLKYWGQGVSRATTQFMKYAELRIAGVPKNQAINKAMPLLSKAHLELDPTAHEAVKDILESTIDKVFPAGTVRRMSQSVRGKLLSVFSHSELFNRLVTMEGAYMKGLNDLPGSTWHFTNLGRKLRLPRSRKSRLVREAATEFASEVTYMTQFGGGPLQRPAGTLNWWSPWSQFTTFPSRMMSLVGGPMLRHPGYGVRAMGMAGGLYELGKITLGADLSRGLLFGGLPEPAGYGPFPVLPVVPPALQLAGATAMTGITGETTHLQRALPLLVPGGIGLARSLPMMPGLGQVVGETVEKPYARWDKRLPDGRVPFYTSQGQLRGYLTETQILAQAFGLGNVSGAQEQKLMQHLLGQRDQVREAKRQYMESLAQNDAAHALRLQEQFERAFPGQGGIPVRDSDIRALHMREDVTRIERLLETLPPELRPEFQAVVSTVLGANYPAMLGMVQPGLEGGQTLSMREPYRHRRLGSTTGRVNRGLHGVHYRAKLRDEGVTGLDNRSRPAGTYYTRGGS